MVSWLIIVLLAVIFMPNIGQTANNSYQNHNVNQKQIDQAQSLQSKWGHQLGNTDQVFVVYNNPSGKINAKQQNNIYHSISKLQNDKNGIKKITSLKTTPSAENRLLSNDKSTEIVVLNVDKSIQQDSTYANELRGKFAAEGLSTHVTNQNIINNVNSNSVMSKTTMVGVIVFILAALFIGLVFRSLIAPLILSITNVITYLTSIGLITLLVNKFKLSFSYYSTMAILMSTVMIGTLISFYIYHRFEELQTNEEDEITTMGKIMKSYTYQLFMMIFILVIAFGSLLFINYAPIQSFALISIALIVTAIGTANITAFFMQILGATIFWPRQTVSSPSEHRLWQKLSNFSLWQPVAGIILILYIICPFAFSYRTNITYNLNNNQINQQQSVVGRNLVNLHFNEGKSTPVTLYLKNQQKFNNANTLLAIDQITTKLQSNPNIKSVYSVTQPGGFPVSKYQLKSQLASVYKNISSAQSTLSSTNTTIKNNVKGISPKNLNNQIKKLNDNRTNLNNLINNISSTQTNLSGSISNVNSAQAVKINKKQKKQKKQLRKYLNQLNQELNNSITELSSLQSSISNNTSNASDQEVALKKYYYQLRKTKSNLNRANSSVKKSNKSIKSIAKYLNTLQTSDAAKVYYITPSQIEDTDFYQSMYNFNSEDQKATMLEINLKDAPDQSDNLKRVENLKQQVNLMLQGSRLQKSEIAYSGVPIDNAASQSKGNQLTLIAFGTMILVLWIGLIIVSRSILHPLYWTITFVISAFAGLQITQMSLSYLTNNSVLDSNSIFMILTPVMLLAAIELIPLAISYRKDNPDMMKWLSYEINHFGQKVRYLIFGVIMIAIGLLYSNLNAFLYVSLTLIFTTILFNIALPLLITALGKLAIKLPQDKLNDWLNKKS